MQHQTKCKYKTYKQEDKGLLENKTLCPVDTELGSNWTHWPETAQTWSSDGLLRRTMRQRHFFSHMTKMKNICQGLREYLSCRSDNPFESKRYGWETQCQESIRGLFQFQWHVWDWPYTAPIKSYDGYIV